MFFTLILQAGAEEISYQVPVIYKWTDEVDGEKIRRVLITPRNCRCLPGKNYVFPNNDSREVEIIVKSLKKKLRRALSVYNYHRAGVHPQNSILIIFPD